MLQALLRSQPPLGINRQTPPNQILGLLTHILPIFGWIKPIIPRHNSLHFLDARVTVKGRVTTEQKVGYDPESPDINRFSVAGLFEDFGGHVAWCAAGGGEDVKGFFVDDAGEAKVCDEEVRIFCWSAEEEVFGL